MTQSPKTLYYRAFLATLAILCFLSTSVCAAAERTEALIDENERQPATLTINMLALINTLQEKEAQLQQKERENMALQAQLQKKDEELKQKEDTISTLQAQVKATKHLVNDLIIQKYEYKEKEAKYRGCNALHVASKEGDMVACEFFITNHPNLATEVVQHGEWKGMTAIHLAILHFHTAICALLVHQDAKLIKQVVQHGPWKGMTALQMARHQLKTGSSKHRQA